MGRNPANCMLEAHTLVITCLLIHVLRGKFFIWISCAQEQLHTLLFQMWIENSLAVRTQCRLSSLDLLQTILGLLPLTCSELLDPGDSKSKVSTGQHAKATSLSAGLLQRYNEFGVVRLEWDRCCWNCEPNQQFPGIANQEGSVLCSEHSTEAVRTKHHWNSVGSGHSLCCSLRRIVVKQQSLTSVKWLQDPRQVLGACDTQATPCLPRPSRH